MFTGIVKTFPNLSIACNEIIISLNSFLKQPEFILIPPPTLPGIQDKNSKPPILFCIANSDSCLSKTPLGAIIVVLFNNLILENFLINFITTPLNIITGASARAENGYLKVQDGRDFYAVEFGSFYNAF